jgi:aerobic carbon-monoxide dehydrogenase small subunit
LLNLTINGKQVTIEESLAGRTRLVDLLRERLHLRGVHVSCEQGICGACTVLLDGDPIKACLVLAGQVAGSSVETVEGLASAGKLNALQAAFRSAHALQCGFCTPGMLMSCTALLRHNDDPTSEEIREAISGNLCRCTGYEPIVEAVMAVASR